MDKCCIKDCEKRVLARGMCAMHYARMRKNGNPNEVRLKQLHGATLQQRFDHYVQKGSGCWLWNGSTDANGYGRLNVGGRPILAHRISWELHCGPITPSEHVLHRCDNPPCINPAHLFLGDQAANNRDMIGKGRFRPGHVTGEQHGCAVLTDDLVRGIRASKDDPQSIADRLGISRRTVRDIQSRRSWRHIK